MPTYEITSPDGKKFDVTAPAGATEAQVLAYARAQWDKAPPAAPTADPTEGFVENALAGFGQSYHQTARGLGQAVGAVSQAEVDEANKYDKPLNDTAGGFTGNVAGHVSQMILPGGAIAKGAAHLLPMVPKLAPFLASAATGAGSAGAQPVLEGQSRGGNAAMGGAAGVAGQGVASGLGALANRAVSAIQPEVRALYEKAQAAGIPVNAAQLGDSKFVKYLQSTLEHLPFTGAVKSAQKQQDAFNTAVSKTIGEDASKLTSDVYAKAKARIGAEFERLTQNNSLPATPQLAGKLSVLSEDAAKYGTKDSANAVASFIDDVFSKVDNNSLPGRAYQSIDSKLGQLMRAGGEKAHYLGQLRDVLREAMDDGISGADKVAWDTARKQYKNLKTIRDLVAKDPTGDISPALLMGRVTANNSGKEAMASGRGSELGDLAQIGKQFLRQSPNSGTVPRSIAAGGLGSVGGAAFLDPTMGLLTAGALGTTGLLGNLTNRALNSPAASRYLLGGGAPGLLQSAPYPYLAPASLPLLQQ